MADFYLFTPVRTKIDMLDSPNLQHGLRLLVPLVGLALTGCAWPMAGDASKPELNAQAWIEQRYEHAKGMLAEGHYGLALQNFRDVLRYDRYSVKALNGLAASYDKLGRYDLAQRYYKKALVVEPTSFQTLNNIGYSYLLAGKYEEAREFLGKAAAIDGTNATVIANLKQLVAKEVAALSEKSAAKVSEAGNAPSGDATGEADNERRMWVERSSAAVQVLITRPDSYLVEWANSNGIEPRWVHIEKPEGTTPASRITVLTERYPVVKPASGPSLTAAARQPVDSATGPAVTAAASPAVSGPEALSMSKPGAGDAAAGVAQTPAPEASTENPSASAATEPASNSGIATAENTAKAPETTTEQPSVNVAADPAPASRPHDIAGTGESAKAPEVPAGTSSAKTDNVAARPALVEAGTGAAGPTADANPDAAGIPGDAPRDPVKDSPVVSDRGDGKPLDLTPTPPADTSVAGAPVQSAGLSSGTDAAEPKADAKTNWIETPWRDPRPQDAVPKPAIESGPESSDPVPQATGSREMPSDSDQQTTIVPAKTDAVTTTSDSESGKPPKGNDQLAALGPVEPDFSEHRAGQDTAQPRVLEISNGAGRLAMAARMEEHLKSLNIPLVNLTNAMSYTNKKTVLYFKPGFEGAAMRVSLLLPLRPELRRNPALVPDLRLVLGGDMLDFDRLLIARLVADSTR
jgi:hypothetical protein